MLHTLLPLKPYRSEIVIKSLAPEIKTAWRQLSRSPYWTPFIRAISSLSKATGNPTSIDLSGDTISINPPPALANAQLEELCRKLVPWRVGPYRIGEFEIDSEWRSYIKWSRVKPLLGDLAGKRVADVGCSSGYFLLKISADDPELAVGFDPVERCWAQFSLLQALSQRPQLAFLPTGISSLDAFPQFFDTIICMGVIYHQRDPFSACKKLFAATRPGGQVILESLAIPSPGSHLLIPRERYAKMRNAWIIPTPEALETLMARAGFSDLKVHTFGPITTDEQRRTEWAPYESLSDFLDPNDPTKTIEGYPAPHSALVVGRKG
ncbi:MAG: tRNA 5-methoxyuridine(34)/uridine 5-oxyacetic acid(34) synthase CmoB [Pseudomonadota bacterium]|jgi:tRNA (mo5U34)-methyltransferase